MAEQTGKLIRTWKTSGEVQGFFSSEYQSAFQTAELIGGIVSPGRCQVGRFKRLGSRADPVVQGTAHDFFMADQKRAVVAGEIALEFLVTVSTRILQDRESAVCVTHQSILGVTIMVAKGQSDRGSPDFNVAPGQSAIVEFVNNKFHRVHAILRP